MYIFDRKFYILNKLDQCDSRVISTDFMNAFLSRRGKWKITPTKIESYLNFFIKMEYITAERRDSVSSYLTITTRGRDYIDQYKTIRFQFWIPLSISTALSIAALLLSILR